MKLLREIIRSIILEGPVKDSFDELWYNTEEERETYQMMQSGEGTYHRDTLADQSKNYLRPYTDEFMDQFFDDKRDLKRLWNETIDANGLRSFWEGPKMKYFHSLSYYGSAINSVDQLQQGEYSDDDIRDLSLAAFLREYKKSDNKDEMSTWGYHVPSNYIACPPNQMILGVILKGRVTLASATDAWTESRSKASKKDMARMKSSGLPKRVMPTDDNVEALLFEEGDMDEKGDLGECILDNWSIETIVYNPNTRTGAFLGDAVRQLSEEYGIPWMTVKDAFGDVL